MVCPLDLSRTCRGAEVFQLVQYRALCGFPRDPADNGAPVAYLCWGDGYER
ncbi:hypothetical protein BDQ17DRAFT_1102433 [Cyathus striatus]|nr:hypothetical protein BDQ17DRAFT_1102433 [Cyathus striatus]